MSDKQPLRKPQVLSRQSVARSRLFHIESLELRFANGAERTFERLTGSDQGAVMIIAMPDPDHVLLIREYAAGFEDYVLTLPKGLVDPGEDIVTAANRELMEECGFGARRIEPLVELSLAPTTCVIACRCCWPPNSIPNACRATSRSRWWSKPMLLRSCRPC